MIHPDSADLPWEDTPPPPGPWDAPEPALPELPEELDFEGWTPAAGPVDPPQVPVAPPETGPGWSFRLAAFDLETTGVDVDSARIVSACVAVLEPDGTVVARWDWLADPGIEIPEGAAAVHGITTERARAEGRPLPVVVAEVAQALRSVLALGIPLVVYNAPYDLTLLDRECRRHGIPPLAVPSPVIDPLVLDKHVDRYRRGKRTLAANAALYEVALDDAHDAGADAVAAGRLAQTLARRYPERLGALDGLHDGQTRWYAAQAAGFEEYVRTKKGDPDFVADRHWPLRPLPHPAVLEDTQPLPALPPRPSRTVPTVLFDDDVPPAIEAPAPAAARRPAAQARSLRIAAALVSDAIGRTLLVRKRGTNAYIQPGGKIERGESALDALARELAEELGLVLDPADAEYLGSFRAPAANEADTVVAAEVYAVSHDGVLAAGSEIEELLWLNGDGVLPDDVAPLTRDVLLPIWASRRPTLF